MLHRAVQLKRGDSILIHGAAGGVGTALLQLGKLIGLKMYGTASAGKHRLVESFGGIPIDYKNEDVENKMKTFVPEGVAAAYDATGEWLHTSYRLLRLDGSLIVFGASSMLDKGRKNLFNKIRTYFRFSIFLMNLLPVKKSISFYTVTKYKKLHPEWFKQDLIILFDLLKQGKIKPVIAMRTPLEEAALCHELLNGSKVSGKMVLLPNGS
jgi:NADPH2:quinone reductase